MVVVVIPNIPNIPNNQGHVAEALGGIVIVSGSYQERERTITVVRWNRAGT
jgi:hypothetical protein